MSIIYRHALYDHDPAHFEGPEGNGRIQVMSTFSGIGAASVSWNPNHYEFVAYAEPEAFPAHVLHYRRGAGRPIYLPDPDEAGITPKERKVRQARVRDVARLPDSGITNFGDITQISDDDLRTRLGTVHVLEGGSPCQAFSVAGARQGLEDPRGNLLLAFCQLAERMKKINDLEFVVWENVHGVLSDKTNGFGCLLASLAGETGGPLQPPGRRWPNAGRVLGPEGREVAWRTIEASTWGVPQRRKRVFVVANFGKPSKGFGQASEVLFEFEGVEWSAGKGIPTRQAVVSTFRGDRGFELRSAQERIAERDVLSRLDMEASDTWFKREDPSDGTFALDMKSNPTAGSRAYALTAQAEHNPQVAIYAVSDEYAPKASKDSAYTLMAGSPTGGGRRQVVVHPQTAGTLCASAAGLSRPAGMASELDFVVVTKSIERATDNWIVRRFTPLECERLQGFPDHWTDVPFKGKLVSDNHRYKALGNSMPCPVMVFIGHQLQREISLSWHFDDEEVWKAPERKRGRPPKHGVAMTDAERQRKRRERLRKAEISDSGLRLGGLMQDISELRNAIEEGSPDIHDRLSAIEAQLQRLAK
jgi:DNA (cytosine-5)-methyltransferase 1